MSDETKPPDPPWVQTTASSTQPARSARWWMAVVAAVVVGGAVVGLGAALLTRGDGSRHSAKSLRPRMTTSTTSASTSTSTQEIAADTLTRLIAASGLGDPVAVSVPAVTNDATKGWLAGDGHAAAAMVAAVKPLWIDGRPACTATANALDAVAAPWAIADAATRTPDRPTRDILLDLHTATASALRACSDEATFETARAELAWQWSLADKRLAAIGVSQ